MIKNQYRAYRYAADGHAGEPGDGATLYIGSLDECRAVIAKRIDGPLNDARWSGSEADWDDMGAPADVEAYSESQEEGCGGWAIHRTNADVYYAEVGDILDQDDPILDNEQQLLKCKNHLKKRGLYLAENPDCGGYIIQTIVE